MGKSKAELLLEIGFLKDKVDEYTKYAAKYFKELDKIKSKEESTQAALDKAEKSDNKSIAPVKDKVNSSDYKTIREELEASQKDVVDAMALYDMRLDAAKASAKVEGATDAEITKAEKSGSTAYRKYWGNKYLNAGGDDPRTKEACGVSSKSSTTTDSSTTETKPVASTTPTAEDLNKATKNGEQSVADMQNEQYKANNSSEATVFCSKEHQKILDGYTYEKTNTFYMDVKVFLEGVQVPHASVSVSYGITGPATATVIIPAHNFLRDLPGVTKLAVFFKDLLPDKEGKYKYRLLFDGELSGYSYSINASGAYISISAVHSAAYLTLMQIMCQDVTEYLTGADMSVFASTLCMQSTAGFNKMQVSLLGKIFQKKRAILKSTADVVYLILKYLIEDARQKQTSSAAEWYYKKLGRTPGGYKLLDRIYGVSSGVYDVSLADIDTKSTNTDYNNNDGDYNYDSTQAGMMDVIYNELTKTYGMSDQVACGFIGNFAVECSFNWSNIARDSNPIGIAHWEGDRASNLKKFCSDSYSDTGGGGADCWKNKENSIGIKAQCAFVWHELSVGNYKGAWNKISKYNNDAYKSESGAAAAAEVICTEYEGPSIPRLDRRQTWAKTAWRKYHGVTSDWNNYVEQRRIKTSASGKIVVASTSCSFANAKDVTMNAMEYVASVFYDIFKSPLCITCVTNGEHAEGTYSHKNGYKFDAIADYRMFDPAQKSTYREGDVKKFRKLVTDVGIGFINEYSEQECIAMNCTYDPNGDNQSLDFSCQNYSGTTTFLGW